MTRAERRRQKKAYNKLIKQQIDDLINLHYSYGRECMLNKKPLKRDEFRELAKEYAGPELIEKYLKVPKVLAMMEN